MIDEQWWFAQKKDQEQEAEGKEINRKTIDRQVEHELFWLHLRSSLRIVQFCLIKLRKIIWWHKLLHFRIFETLYERRIIEKNIVNYFIHFLCLLSIKINFIDIIIGYMINVYQIIYIIKERVYSNTNPLLTSSLCQTFQKAIQIIQNVSFI